MTPPDSELFREVFGHFATGVAIITASGPAGTGGITANALCSVSLEPPLALVCLENGARTLPIIRGSQHFALNVLHAGQQELALRFASKMPEADKLAGIAHRLERGVPVIDDVLAWAVCTLHELLPAGDHTIAMGNIVEMGKGSGEPLVWYRGDYRALH
jgi:3-hydroxy-9,10-secoandrosta-1,3,5(10)-triene-9,17-dione monooxygenase reductase component